MIMPHDWRSNYTKELLALDKAAVAAAIASGNEWEEISAGDALADAVCEYAKVLIKAAPSSRRRTLQLLARVADNLLEEGTEIVSDPPQDLSWQHLSTGNA